MTRTRIVVLSLLTILLVVQIMHIRGRLQASAAAHLTAQESLPSPALPGGSASPSVPAFHPSQPAPTAEFAAPLATSFPSPFSPQPQSASLGELQAGLAYVHGSVAPFDPSQIAAISRLLKASEETAPDLEQHALLVGDTYSLGAERLLRRPQLEYVMRVNKIARLRPVADVPHFVNPLVEAILERLRRIGDAPRSQAADVPNQLPTLPTLKSDEMNSRLACLLEEPAPELAVDREQAIALIALLEPQEAVQVHLCKLKYDLFQVCNERQKDALVTFLVQAQSPRSLSATGLLRELR